MRVFIIIALIFSLNIKMYSQYIPDVKGVSFTKSSLAFNFLNKLNNYYSLEYFSLKTGRNFNYGAKYMLGFSGNSNYDYTTYQGYGFFSDQYQNTLTYHAINYGIGLMANKYITGNFFDGGLYGEFAVTLEQSFIRGSVSDSKLISSSIYVDQSTYDSQVDYIQLTYGSFLTVNVEPKIGYAIPLQRSNLSFFFSFNKSVYGIATEAMQSQSGTPTHTIVTRRFINFGASFHFFG